MISNASAGQQEPGVTFVHLDIEAHNVSVITNCLAQNVYDLDQGNRSIGHAMQRLVEKNRELGNGLATLHDENLRLQGIVDANNKGWAHGGADEYQALRRLEKAATELVRDGGATPLPDGVNGELRAPMALWNELLGPVCALLDLRKAEATKQAEQPSQEPSRG